MPQNVVGMVWAAQDFDHELYLLELKDFATFEPLLSSQSLRLISKLLYQAALVCKKSDR